MVNLTKTADYLAEQIAGFSGNKFTIMSAGEGQGLPLVAWRLTNKEHYDEFAIARTLRERSVRITFLTTRAHLHSTSAAGSYRHTP